MLISVGSARSIGAESGSWLAFGEERKPDGSWAGRRLLLVKERPAFELSFWCGTCQFLFRRLDGANEVPSAEDLRDHLRHGIADLDEDVIDRFAAVLPHDSYIPMLLRIHPRLVMPARPGDYFAEEQVGTWGVNAFWGLPEYPRTPYYRTFQTQVGRESHLYEFVVPMVPPSWNDRERVEEFASILVESDRPTAVAVSVLDVCQPATEVELDYYAHWGLTHFLLDGHHKMEAAAVHGRSLQLLTLLAVGASLATQDQVASVPRLRSRPQEARPRQ